MGAPLSQAISEAIGNNLPSFIPFDPNELLIGYQKRWVADQSPLKIAEKSRRTGITWAEAADASITAGSAKNAGGTNHFYVGSNKEMAREFIEAVAMWAKAFDKAAGDIQEEVLQDEDKDILTFVVHFASGFKVQALSSKPSNLRGMQGNVTIDEAAFHEKLDEVLKAALALTMWGAKVRLISTHNGVDNLFNELIIDSKSGKKRYSVHTITLDDACAEGLYQRICQVQGIEWTQELEDEWKDNLLKDTASLEDALEEYQCIPKQGGGAYISRTLLESRAKDAPVIRFTGSAEFNASKLDDRKAYMTDWIKANLDPVLAKLNPDLSHSLGQDFARSGDLTVMMPLEIGQTLRRRAPFSVEFKNTPFSEQRQVLFHIINNLPRFTGAALDSRGNGQQLAEETRDEFGSALVEEVMLTQSWYAEHMPLMKSALEDDELHIPKDKDVIDDMRCIQVVKGIPKIPDGNTAKTKGQQRHGDAAVAICLAYAASFMDGLAYGYESAKPTKRDDDDYQRDIKTTYGMGRRGRSML